MVLIKADILWELGQINEGLLLLEDYKDNEGLIDKKRNEIKKNCEETYGLAHDHAELFKIEKFIKWMRDEGAFFKGVRMKYYAPDYRGVHSYQQINQNEIFLNVPKKLIITPQSGKESIIGAKVLSSKVQVSWDYLVYITIFLLAEMHNPSSKWKPYLDLYPRLVDNFPMFYSDNEKSLLKGTPMIEQIASELDQLKEEYNRIVSAVPEFKMFTQDEYIKNKTLVISRIFYVKIKDSPERIMVPLAGKHIFKSDRYV